MVNRKSEQGDAAIEAIKKESESDAKIEWVGCDMGSLKQVKEVFTKMREREERLDLVRSLPITWRGCVLTGIVDIVGRHQCKPIP